MQPLLMEIGLILGAYLLGSIPSGLIIAQLISGTDVRTHGSGNTGMVNVFRAAGPLAGMATFALDGLKGFLPVFIGQQLGLPVWSLLLIATATIIGHNWSILLRGKGGKGVATSVGTISAFAPVVALIAIGIWVALLLTFRYASLASMLMIASLPPVMALFHYELSLILFGVALLLLSIYQHRQNILRLREGSELKISRGATRVRHSD
jgi:acyl phosphate:glycerol-3-phosphate acyltransferase